MGIRFRCHHCEHELHVKDFQGGKRGRCPDCQGKFRIPLRDAEYSSDPDEAWNPDDNSSNAAQPTPTPTPTQSPSASQSVPSQAVSGTPAAGKSAVLSPTSKPVSSTTKPASLAIKPTSRADAPISGAAPQPAPLRAAAPLDPPAPPPATAEASQPQALLDAPQAAWFVRPPSGGQYGPAPSDSMWQWLCENRISRDSLVWCEGWPEWLVASQVFSDYFANNNLDDLSAPSLATAAAQSSPLAATESGSALSGEAQPTSLGDRNRAGRKQRRKRNYTVLIAILSVVMIALIVALVIVLTKQQAAV